MALKLTTICCTPKYIFPKIKFSKSYSFAKVAAYSISSEAAAVSMVKVGAVQMTSVGDIDDNFNTCSRLIKDAAEKGVKLLCFPESFSFIGMKNGESLGIAEPLEGSIMPRYCSLARESNIWLSLGGFQEKGPEDDHIYNTHVLVDSSGKIRNTYRKIHLFDVDVPGNMVYKESDFTTAGNDIISEDSPAGRLGLTVCYDLRFPELYQQLRFQHHAQVLLVPAAFTKVTGEAHWEILLRARAIETQCYVVAAAQAGKHNQKRESYGDSLIIDPWGKILARLPDRLSTGIAIADIDLATIDSVRTRMPISEEKFMAERQRLLEETGRDQLTPDEEDVIFQSVMDPPSQNRRYGFGSQVASSQRRGRQTRADIDLAEIEELRSRVAQLEDQNRRQSIEMTQLLDQRIAEYMQQYGGRFPSSVGSGGSADE